MERRNGRAAAFVAAGVAALAFTLSATPATDDDRLSRREVADLIGAARDASATRTTAGVSLDARAEESGGATLTTSIPDGVAWLEADQNPDGSWGASLRVTVTGSAVESLAEIDSGTPAVENGALWLEDQVAENHEFLARQTIALGGVPGFEDDALQLAVELLGLRNPVENDPSLPNWPEGGWGLLPGYETDCLTTSLALRGIDRGGLNGGFAVIDESLAGGATNVHPWEIPVDAIKARIEITVTGSTVRLRMTEGRVPDVFDPYFELPPGGPYLIVFPDSGLPFTPGTNYIAIESPDPPALPATYTMTASYETPLIDTRWLAEALDYLRESQNVDGGWGLQRGQPTDFYTTLHVVLGLLAYLPYDFDAEVASAVAYVESQQLVDGSFGYDGSTVPYVTALASLNLIGSGSCPFSTATHDAIAALLALQAPDGSWDQQAYDTALAVQALWRYDSDGDDVDNCADPCPLDDPDDTDADGVCDTNDPCPFDNPDDSDGDGVCDSADVCAGGDDTVDADGDTVPDFCDGCPLDPSKTVPGVCGCGTADVDTDGDGVEDCNDPCPLDNPDDSDADGVCDIEDLCLGGDDGLDADADGAPDFCDCAPADPGATGPPEVADLTAEKLAADTVRLSWPAVAGADYYAVTRGLLSGLAPDRYGSCLDPAVPGTTLDDPDIPPVGDGYGYLIQSGGTNCGLGTMGQDGAGADRDNQDPGRCL